MGSARQLLPFDGAIERCSSIRQNAVDAASVYALFRQETAESPLFLRGNVRNGGFGAPKLLPVSKAVPRRGSAGELLRMLKPVIQKYGLD
jgi:hypothetical protein